MSCHQHHPEPQEEDDSCPEPIQVVGPAHEGQADQRGADGQDVAQPKWDHEERPLLESGAVDSGDPIGELLDQFRVLLHLGHGFPEPGLAHRLAGGHRPFRLLQNRPDP